MEKKFIEIGNRLRQVRHYLRLEPGDFALLFDKRRDTINKYLNGNSKIDEDMLDILENKNISRQWIKTGEG